MLTTHSLTFAYPGGEQMHFSDMTATSDAPLLILGQSGVGKTTLLHLLAGLLRPQSGQIVIGKQDITQLSTREMDQFRGRSIGLVFQQAHFVQALTVHNNLRMVQYLAGVKQDPTRIETLLTRLGIPNKGQQPVRRLSLGEQQRVSIARAVINQPQLILADEPTSALDDHNAAEVMDLLEETARQAEAALVIVTHDQRLKDRIERQVLLGDEGY